MKYIAHHVLHWTWQKIFKTSRAGLQRPNWKVFLIYRRRYLNLGYEVLQNVKKKTYERRYNALWVCNSFIELRLYKTHFRFFMKTVWQSSNVPTVEEEDLEAIEYPQERFSRRSSLHAMHRAKIQVKIVRKKALFSALHASPN